MIDSVSQNVNELNVKPISIIIGGDLCHTDSIIFDIIQRGNSNEIEFFKER